MVSIPRRALPKQQAFVTLAIVCIFATAGCGQLPQPETLLTGPQVSAALGQALGMPVGLVPVTYAASMTNVTAVYQGGTPYENVLIIVFDSPDATGQITGPSAPGAAPQQAAIVWKNVAVIYRRQRSAPDRQRTIRTVLRQL